MKWSSHEPESWVGELQSFGLPDGWVLVEGEMKARLEAELGTEAGPGHVVHGQRCSAVARCEMCDDVLFRLIRRWGLVHLTWVGRREQDPRWPTTKVFDHFAELLPHLRSRD